ncbi:bola-like protein [Tilletiaria anomala UBC 951]|uniref:Bola-like protein n=1 Tax=Tilletiaria anomala (strain ATCC 24038 / CBS 436.72 / UBC 951) TaxID=1037660 RepID=A0A066WN55_TILAU|nr:bola-like protein [Tilletiaria anomala UBC 951]KDN52409.1 bola-like protein [Tilletiaria anomala UBC 951]
MSSSTTPPTATDTDGSLEASMRAKLAAALAPLHTLRIRNDSSKHAHHAAMVAARAQAAATVSRLETHFFVEAVSGAFNGLSSLQRHRMVHALLSDEFQRRGLHALSLRLKTPDEVEKEKAAQQ